MAIIWGEDDYRLQEDQCPHCEKKLDAATILSSEKGRPDPGDYTVCIYCATVLRFEIGLRLAKATRDDLKMFHNEDPKNFKLLGDVVCAAKERINRARRSRFRQN